MSWHRRPYTFDGLGSLGFVIVAWAVALIGIGFTFKIMWKLLMFGWELV